MKSSKSGQVVLVVVLFFSPVIFPVLKSFLNPDIY